jgi:hypothetical protein
MYKIYHFEDKNNDLLETVRKFDWSRGLPGGWLDYAPPRKVTAYGDGSLIKDNGKKYGKSWNITSWAASVPYTNMTSVTKTHPIPDNFLETGILGEVRKALRKFGGKVDDASGTGLWCNYYDKPIDMISSHKDDENYYERNFKNEPLFISLTLYEDKNLQSKDLARFQIKIDGKFVNVPLPHLSLLVMSGDIEHRVMKYTGKNFRKRYNITFRTPISREEDIIKNYRFFSNFGRYYRKTYLLFVPDNIFLNKLPEKGEILNYDSLKNIGISKSNKRYLISDDKSNYTKALKAHSKFGSIFICRNLELNRDDLMVRIKKKYKKAERPPNTTTNHSLYIMLHQKFIL